MGKRVVYTEEEMQYIYDNVKELGIPAVAKHLGRPAHSLRASIHGWKDKFLMDGSDEAMEKYDRIA